MFVKLLNFIHSSLLIFKKIYNLQVQSICKNTANTKVELCTVGLNPYPFHRRLKMKLNIFCFILATACVSNICFATCAGIYCCGLCQCKE